MKAVTVRVRHAFRRYCSVNDEIFKEATQLWDNNSKETAVQYFTEAALNGHVEAMNSLGFALVEEGDSTGLSWIEKAAAMGSPNAQNNLAVHLNQKGDHEAALDWWKQAAAGCNPYALNQLGLRCSDDSEAYGHFKEAAEKGDKEAMNNLGHCYQHGKGTQQESTKAIAWYSRSAGLGNLDSLYNLGHIHLDIDKSMALRYFTEAAVAGHVEGQAMVGFCYQQGIGTSCDAKKAVEWWEKAADNKHPAAATNLGICLQQGAGVGQPDPQRAMQYFEAAAEQDYPEALVMLANCKLNGEGTEKDTPSAILLMSKAAALGSEQAKRLLAILHTM